MDKNKKAPYDKSVLIKLTKEQYIDIKKRQRGDNFSAWVRSLLLDQAMSKKIQHIAVDKEFTVQLAKAGSNLNQIARSLNLAKSDDKLAVIDYLKLATILLEIKEQLSDILQAVRAGKGAEKADDF